MARLPITPGSWDSFVDAWVQHHDVSLSEQARAALCTAMGCLSESELAAIRARPAIERITRNGITYRPEAPVQLIAAPRPARITRTPPAPAAAAPSARARIVRRAGAVK